MSLYLYGRVAAVGFGGIRFASNFQPDYTWPLQANNEDIFKNHFLWIVVRLYNCTQFMTCFVCAWLVSVTLESWAENALLDQVCTFSATFLLFCSSCSFDEVAKADLERKRPMLALDDRSCAHL